MSTLLVQEMKDHQDEAMTKLLHGLDALLVVRLESMCGRVHAKEALMGFAFSSGG